jgi:signal transduction histidine kinase
VTALYAWLRRHPRLVDGALAAPLALISLAQAVTTRQYLLILVALGLTVPIVVRRQQPVGAFGVAMLAGAVQVLANLRPVLADLAILVLLYTLAAYSTRRISVTGLGVCLYGGLMETLRLRSDLRSPAGIGQPPGVVHTAPPGAGLTVTGPSVIELTLLIFALFAGPALIAWVLGDSTSYRRAYYVNLEERAARLERERDAHAQIAAAAERARIARELHDVVAHNVSVMVVQADGAAYALDADPDRARTALAAISATGRQALTEMRALLGVLRRGDAGTTEATLSPVPDLGQLDELLEQARAVGLRVRCVVEGEPQPLAAGTELTVYRIIQESLTNTRKHAGPMAAANVLLRYSTDAIEVTVTDDGVGAAASCDGAGHGLTGMTERAVMYGGSVRAGPRPEGGFEVCATMPVTPVTPVAAVTAATAATAATAVSLTSSGGGS